MWSLKSTHISRTQINSNEFAVKMFAVYDDKQAQTYRYSVSMCLCSDTSFDKGTSIGSYMYHLL
jgi:hypothetical protein